jgi:hypothetical protein
LSDKNNIEGEIKGRMITLKGKYLLEYQDGGKGILKVIWALTSLIH